MNREKFVSKYLDDLIKDKDIKKYFISASEREKEMLKGNLRMSLENSYETYAKEYFDSKGLGSYLSTFLRYTGAGADAIGTYMFWVLGGAGFGIKGIGLLEKTTADAIDSYHYARHAKTKNLGDKLADTGKIAGEGLAERALAYLPLGLGESADLIRGKSKFNRKVIGRAVQYAKNKFIDYISRVEEKEPYIVSLDKFRNPEYFEEGLEDKALAA